MTAALRGFNMELNTTSAMRVNDVYSKLAAITASDTQEISVAMTKVASLAHNANMEFETTSAFLAQIIETTRESAETAGTALKTVIARFSEVKKLYSEGELVGTDEEGNGIDVNKISTALRTAGIDLNKYFLGEVGLDDIFLELASRWDSLTEVQQRYIATQAAGSRQQSRFIAMMQNYKRTQELISAAYNSNGASADQFSKTQDSLESKLNQLTNAWNTFTMNLANSGAIKSAVDSLTNLLEVVNSLTEKLGGGWTSAINGGLLLGGIFGGRSLLKSTGAGLSGLRETGTLAGFGKAWSAYRHSVDENGNPIKTGGLFNGRGSLVGWTPFASAKNKRAQEFQKQAQEDVNNYQKAFDQASENVKDITAGYSDEEIEWAKKNTDLFNEQEQAVRNLENAKNKLNIENQKVSQSEEKLVAVQKRNAALSKAITGVGMLASLGGSLMKNIDGASESLQSFGDSISVVGTAMTTGTMAAGPWGGAIAAAAATIIEVYNKTDLLASEQVKQYRNAQRFAELSNSEYKQSSSAVETLTKSFSTLTNNYSQMDNLVVGTEAWRSKLAETNQIVLDLINNFPQLAPQIRDAMEIKNGQIILSQEDMNSILEQAEQAEEAWGRINKSAEQAQKVAEVNKKYSNKHFTQADVFTGRDIETSFDSHQLDRIKELYDQYGSVIFDFEKDVKGRINTDKLTEPAKEVFDILKNVGAINGKDKITNQNLFNSYISYLDEIKSLSTQGELDLTLEINTQIAKEKLPTDKDILSIVSSNLSTPVEVPVETKLELQTLVDRNKGKAWNENDLARVKEIFEDSPNYAAIKNLTTETAKDFDFISQYEQFNKIEEGVKNYKEIIDSVNEVGGNLSDLSATLTKDWTSLSEDTLNKYLNAVNEKYKEIKETYGNIFTDEEIFAQAASQGNFLLEGLFGTNAINKTNLQFQNVIDLIGQYETALNSLRKEFAVSFGPESANLADSLDRESLKYLDVAYNKIKDISVVGAYDLVKAITEAENGIKSFSQSERNAFASLDASKPIETFTTLKNLLSTGSKEAQNLASSILDNNYGVLGASNQFLEMWGSESFEDTYKSIQKTIKKTNSISSSDVLQLAEQYETLQTVMENTGINANGMAKVFTLLGNQDLNIENITDSLLSAASAFKTVDTAISDVLDSIKNFDAGIDENNISSFISDAYDTIKSNLDIGAVGNNQNKTLVDFLFGKDFLKGASGEEYVKRLNIALDELKANSENALASWDKLASGKDVFGKQIEDLSNLGIELQKLSDGTIHISAIEDGLTTERLINNIQSAYGVSQNYAAMMVGNLKNYSAEFAQVMESFDTEEAIRNWWNSLPQFNGKKMFSNQDLSSLGKLIGENDNNKLLESLSEIAGEEITIPIHVDDGEIESIEDKISGLKKAFGEDLLGLKTNDLFDYEKIKATLDKQGWGQYFNDIMSSLAETQGSFYSEVLGKEVSLDGKKATDAYKSAIQGADYEQLGKTIATGIYQGIQLYKGEISIDDFFNTNELTSQATESGSKVGQAFSNAITPTLNIDNTLALEEVEQVKTEIDTISKEKPEVDINAKIKTPEEAAREILYKTLSANFGDTFQKAVGIINESGASEIARPFQEINDILSTLSADEINEINDAFKDIKLNGNLKDTLSTWENLTDNVKSSNKAISKISKQLLDSSDEFSDQNLLKSYLMSEEYQELTEDIDELIEKNGKLTGKNLKDLAKSGSKLDKVLKQTKTSANALAKAINAIGKEASAIDKLTDSLLAAADALYTLDDLIDDVEQWLDDFDPGRDFGRAADEVVEWMNKAKEYATGWEFGNEQTQNYYDQVYGEGAYNKFMRENWGKIPFDELSKRLNEKFDIVSNDIATNSKGFMEKMAKTGALGITGSLEKGFDWDLSNFKDSADLIKQIQQVTGYSEGMSKALVSGWAAQSWDFAKEFNRLDIPNSIKAWRNAVGNIGGQKIVDQSEIDSLANLYGIDSKTLSGAFQGYLKDIAKLRTEFGLTETQANALIDALHGIKTVDFGLDDGEVTFKEFQDAIESVTNEFKDFKDAKGRLSFDELKNSVSQAGLSSQFENIFNSALAEGESFVAELNGKLQTIEINPGETAMEAYQRVAEDARWERIGQVLSESFSENLNKIDTIGAQDFLGSLQTKAEEVQSTLTEESVVKIDTTEAEQNLTNLQEKAKEPIQLTIDLKGADNSILQSLSDILGYDVSEGQTISVTVDQEQLSQVTALSDAIATIPPETISSINISFEGSTKEEIEDTGAAISNVPAAKNPRITVTVIGEDEVSSLKGDIAELQGQQPFSIDISQLTSAINQLKSLTSQTSSTVKIDIKDAEGKINYTVGTIETPAQEELDKDAKVIYGVDDNAVQSYLPPDKSAWVTYHVNPSAVNAWTPPQKTGVVVYRAEMAGGGGIAGGIGALGSGIRAGMASGGIVGSFAKGGEIPSYAASSYNRTISPGPALTGEEGPEIVWNKEKGYAYITGQHHPEFQDLKPGDHVFNAQETKKILGSAATGGDVFDAYSSGGYPGGGGGGGAGGGGGMGDMDEPEEWRNELDWLYNLMEDITELEREQKDLQEEYNDLLEDQSANGRQLFENWKKQLANLYTQLDHQVTALNKREQEMMEFMRDTNTYDQYLWYNWEDRTLEIDWAGIEAIQDQETYDKVEDLVSRAEEIQDKMDDAEDAIYDINNQIQELYTEWRDTFVDFEQRLYDAVVKSYQDVIDKYEDLSDTLETTNSSILDAISKEINLQRQIRDNTKTEEDIANSEAQLAYLRRDTSGGNDLAALQLEEELNESRQNYADSLVDQALSRLEEDNDAAAEQRERQIEIMQAQLDYAEMSGEYWNYVSTLITEAMGDDGELLTNTRLEELLQNAESWKGLSDTNKQVWEEELNNTFKEVAAWILRTEATDPITGKVAGISDAIEGVSAAINSYSQAVTKYATEMSSAMSSAMGAAMGGMAGGYSGGGSGGSGGYSYSYQTGSGISSGTASSVQAAQAAIRASSAAQGLPGYAVQSLYSTIKRYATGGLSSSAGLAWLDGTPDKPEYVLNAQQTESFLTLTDILSDIMTGRDFSQASGSTPSDVNLNIAVNVDHINSDYDVERLANQLKDEIVSSMNYRNVNNLSFKR